MNAFLISLRDSKIARPVNENAFGIATDVLGLLIKKQNALNKRSDLKTLEKSKANEAEKLKLKEKIATLDRQIEEIVKGKSSRSRSHSRSGQGKSPAQTGEK